MRISDWSSDVCSSDLKALTGEQLPVALVASRRLAVVRNAQPDVGARQRQRAQPFLHVAPFGAPAAQALAPPRHAVTQVSNLYRGAARMRLRGHSTTLPASDRHAAYGRNASAARAHRSDLAARRE